VNNAGVAVGWSKYANNCDASFYGWTSPGTIKSGTVLSRPWQFPGELEPWYSEATAVNDEGVVAGWATLTYVLGAHAFLYDGATYTDLGTLCGSACPLLSTFSFARDVNSSGDVVGVSDTQPKDGGGDGRPHAFVYSNGLMSDLGTLAGGTSAAYGINDLGQIVGESDGMAFLWDGAMRALGTLGGSSSVATAIINNGQVVGYSTTPSGSTHAFVTQEGQMIDIGTLGGSWSRAYAINRWGQVIGVSATAGDTEVHVFTYGDGVMQDVDALAPAGTSFSKDNSFGREKGPGLSLNDYGTLVGSGACTPTEFCSGRQHAYKLTDTVQPTCELVSTRAAGGRRYMQLVVQELGSGLRTIHVLEASNAAVEVASFQPATPREVAVTVTQKDVRLGFAVKLEAADIAGNSVACIFSKRP